MSVAVLTPSWNSATSEADWALRQVAGALAIARDVHVITTRGKAPRSYPDSVFTVHELACGTSSSSVERRRLLVDALLDSEPTGDEIGQMLDIPAIRNAIYEGCESEWSAATSHLEEISPDLIVIGDYHQVGVVPLVEKACPAAGTLLVPLLVHGDYVDLPLYPATFEHTGAVAVFSEAEGMAIESAWPRCRAKRIGVPLAANESVMEEPNVYVGEDHYVLVLATSIDDSIAGLVRNRFAHMTVATCAPDGFVVARGPNILQLSPVGRGSDLLRLMAFADLTVDLSPGPLFARRCVESLLYETPIVVPHHSRGLEHARLGTGGLWFDSPGELPWVVEALLDSENQKALGAQGQKYAATYASPRAFWRDVSELSGFDLVAEKTRSEAVEDVVL